MESAKGRKTGITLILSLLDDPYHIVLKFQFPAFTSLPALTAADEMLEAMDDTDSGDSSISSSSSMGDVESSPSSKPKPFSQGQLNDLISDLGLSKESSEILASRLDEHGILGLETKITFYRNRDDMLIRFFYYGK